MHVGVVDGCVLEDIYRPQEDKECMVPAIIDVDGPLSGV